MLNPDEFDKIIDSLQDTKIQFVEQLLEIIEWYKNESRKYKKDRDWVYRNFEDHLYEEVRTGKFDINDWDLLMDVIRKEFLD